MPSRNKTLCIFGDSHIGSLRKALDGGKAKLTGYDVEFWGATGPLFRQIDMVDGVVRANGPQAAEIVAQINGRGRETLSPMDFDVYLFYGARLRMADFMVPYLHRMRDPHGAVSDAVLRAAVDGYIASTRAARIARAFGASGKTRVFYAPAPLWTWGLENNAAPQEFLSANPLAAAATKTDRARIWDLFAESLGRDNVTLIRQPDSTVVQGAFTDPKYAVEGADESGDIGHKSAEFAALMLKEFVKAAK